MYSDQTGKFPHVSIRGNKYQIVLHDIYRNSTWVEAMKNKTKSEIILGQTCSLACMNLCGIKPKHQVLDNEAHIAYKEAIRKSWITYQLVPPDEHRRNISEKEIQTWKNRFIRVLCGTVASFPMHLWCQLIPRAERQLLLLRKAYSNPNLSLYANLHSPHEYRVKPFVPLVI